MTKSVSLSKTKGAITKLGRVSKATKGWTGRSFDWTFQRGDIP